MGICNNCIYRGGPYVAGCRRRHLNDFQCSYPANCEVDFVTGEIYNGSCRNHNMYGECKYFDDGSIKFYAWLCNEDIIYTQTDTPFADDKYFTEPGEFEAGTIKSSNILYAWKNKNSVVFTVSQEPQILDTVYSQSGSLEVTVENVGTNKITVDNTDYTRDESQDIPNAFIVVGSTNYFRNKDYDTNYLVEGDDGSN